MRRVLFSIIILVLFIPIFVKADIDCGEYKVVDGSWPSWCYGGGPASGAIVGGRFMLGSIDLGNVSSCPEYIYIVDPTRHTSDSCRLSLASADKLFGTAGRVPPLEDSGRYDDIISCRDADYKYIKDCGCMPAALTDLTSRLYMLIKIAAPALLLIIGGFDLIKAMSAQDEKAINKARQKLVKKFIAAAAVFLIFTLVQFIVSTLASDSASTMKCVDYLLNGYVA